MAALNDSPSSRFGQDLECPVCLNTFTSPIVMCSSGHSFCEDCRKMLDNCPLCRRKFSNSRNFALENLVRQMHVRPRIESVQLDNLQATHVSDRLYRCPLTMISKSDCRWKGDVISIYRHVKHDHVYSKFVNSKPCGGKLHYSISFETSNVSFNRLVFILDELFIVQCKVQESKFSFVVIYAGKEEKASSFKYTFSVVAGNNNKDLLVSLCARKLKDNLDEIVKSGKCVVFPANFVQNFLVEHILKVEVIIEKVCGKN